MSDGIDGILKIFTTNDLEEMRSEMKDIVVAKFRSELDDYTKNEYFFNPDVLGIKVDEMLEEAMNDLKETYKQLFKEKIEERLEDFVNKL